MQKKETKDFSLESKIRRKAKSSHFDKIGGKIKLQNKIER